VFGLVTPCRHTLPAPLHRAWQAHLCGLCLGLRDRYGQLARVTTNVDAAMISVLVAAQAPALAATRTAGPCALRGMRRADVVRSDAPAARLAGGVSLLLAGGMLRDHAADGDLPRPARPVAVRVGRRWEARGGAGLAAVGLDAAALVGVADRQEHLERGGPPAVVPSPIGDARATGPAGARTLSALTAPTEAAVAAALAHTATLAGRPGNVGPLAEAGRWIGRVAHLTDALVDQADDDRRGRWNPLTATGAAPGAGIDEVGRALTRVRAVLPRLDLPGRRPGAPDDAAVQADLAWRLLAEVLPRSVHRVLGRAGLDAGDRIARGGGHLPTCRGRHPRGSQPPWGDPGPPFPPEPGAPGYPPPEPGAPGDPEPGPGGSGPPPGVYPPAHFPGRPAGPPEPLVGPAETARGGFCGWVDACTCCGDCACEGCGEGAGDCCGACDCGCDC
jgi:Family of unknown function (DUF5685)